MQLTNTETGNSPEDQLYHLNTDIGERNNVASQYPAKVKTFKQILEEEKQKGFRQPWIK